MRDVGGQALITIMGNASRRHGLIQAVGGWRHPLSRSGIPLHHTLLAVPLAHSWISERQPHGSHANSITLYFCMAIATSVTDVLARNTPTKIARVLPYAFNPDVPVEVHPTNAVLSPDADPSNANTTFSLGFHHTIELH